jgi:hypothetical protein
MTDPLALRAVALAARSSEPPARLTAAAARTASAD